MTNEEAKDKSQPYINSERKDFEKVYDRNN